MTDNDIIKALEWHINAEAHCSPCPYEEHSVTHSCVEKLLEDCFDLINRQKADNCELQHRIDELQLKNTELKAEIERLQEQSNNYPVRVRMGDYCIMYASSLDDYDKQIGDIGNEAVKEFAEQVKMAFYYQFDELIPSIMADKIDNLVKEMVGDNDAES